MPEQAAFRLAEGRCRQRLPSPREGPFSVQAKQRELAGRVRCQPLAGQAPAAACSWRVHIPEPTGWLRLVGDAQPAEALLRGDRRIRLRMRLAAGEPLPFSVVLLVGEPNGALRVLAKPLRDRRAGPSWCEYGARLRLDLLSPGLLGVPPESPCFVALEFAEAAEVELAEFGFSVPQRPESSAGGAVDRANLAPRPLASPLAGVAELDDLLDAEPHEGRQDRPGWLLRAADVESRLGCVESAEARLAEVDEAMLGGQHERLLQFLRLRARIDVVRGRLAALAGLLERHAGLVQQDDALATSLSVCRLALGHRPSEADLRLPSGRLNRYLAARCGGLVSVAQARSEAEEADLPEREREERLIFLASTLAPKSREVSLSTLNRALRLHGLAPIKLIPGAAGATGASPLMGSLGFAPRPKSPAGQGPKVSVIMCAWNAGATLQHAVRSLLAQTHTNIELLIGDDASSDDTLAQAEAWRQADARVRVFASSANQGPYNLRNALIAQASGQFTTFADADDVSHPERVARALAAFNAEPDTEQAAPKAVLGQWLRLMPDGHIPFYTDHKATRMSLVSIMAPTAMFRERPYRSVLCGADFEWFEGLRHEFGAEAVKKLPAPLIFGLWSPASLTRTPGLEADEDGYRSPARIAYAEVSARQRLLGKALVPDAEVDEVTLRHGIFRAPVPVLGRS